MARFNFQSVLKKHQMRYICEVKRHIKGSAGICGFVVDFSDTLILFQRLEMDTFRLNGYTVIRDDDISRFRFFDKVEYWQFRAIKRLGIKHIHPVGISIASLPELLTSVAKHYPLVTIHPEKNDPDICYVRALSSLTELTFTIDDLDSNAQWTGPRRNRFADVTRVDFDGGYERALAATSPKRSKVRG